MRNGSHSHGPRLLPNVNQFKAISEETFLPSATSDVCATYESKSRGNQDFFKSNIQPKNGKNAENGRKMKDIKG